VPRNSLTKPSNFTRTQHERRSRSSDQGCAGRRGSGGRLLGTLASWNMMLRRKMRRRLRVVQTHRAEKIALDRARSGAPISPQCNRAPKPLNRAHRRRGTLAKSQCKPNFRRLVPTRMASIAGGTRVGRVCSVAFGLIARRVGRVTRIAMVGCASGRTRTIERDTKGAKTRFIAPAYGKFESSSLQQTVRLSRDFSLRYRKAGSCRGVRGPGQAARPAETRRARQHHANCR